MRLDRDLDGMKPLDRWALIEAWAELKTVSGKTEQRLNSWITAVGAGEWGHRGSRGLEAIACRDGCQ